MSDFEESFGKFCDDLIAKNNQKCISSGCEYKKFSFNCEKCRECVIGKDTLRTYQERDEILYPSLFR